ncbi:MBL fold metallo-hydrolase [Baaleninema simplex]|uniref:MBL fold metallo-hydrolase n=1 Tax=Baaleninema simplex TaxID=2862350 RepID=UPI0003455965|nr:MBL fold metallo-hydrolase [Baaleninema simplex]
MTQEVPKSVAKQWFVTRTIHDGLYCITEDFYWEWNRANIWLIKGQTQDLLIDTGLGVASLRHHIAELTDKPLLAIATHVHFDHAGGIHEFDRRAIHACEAEALQQGDNHAALCDRDSGWVQEEHFAELPYPGFTVTEYKLNAAEPTQILHDGDVLDLGDRALEVLHLPGHSPGAIALYDSQKRELFSGDVVYDGDLLDDLPGSEISSYLQSFDRLQKMAIETVYPGHYRIFGQKRFREIVAEYRDGKRQVGCPTELEIQ